MKHGVDVASWYWQFWSQDSGGYSEVHECDNNKN